MDQKKPMNKNKNMSVLYRKLGMVPPKVEGQEDVTLTQGYHYQKIQRNLYRYQQGVDYQRLAQESFLLSAEKGNPEGMYQYALCCLEERTCEKEKEGLDYLHKGATLSHKESLFQLGEYHRELHQYSTAFGWYKQAATLGHPEALFFQGVLPIYCANIPFQEEESQKLFQQARDTGSIQVLFYDLHYFKKSGLVVEQRQTQEILLETLFRTLEDHPAVTFYRLGMGYMGDLFLGEESEEELTQEATETEEDFASRRNQHRLKPLIEQALTYLKESAGLNYNKAQLKLSDYYFKVQQRFPYKYEPNPEEGRKWLSFAMKNKSPDSFALFSLICENGVLEIKSEAELKELDWLSEQRGSMLGLSRRILRTAKSKSQEEKNALYQEGILRFFKEERPIFYWNDILTTIKHISDRVHFLEEVQKRLPFLPAVSTHDVAVRTELLSAYLEQGELEKAKKLMEQDTPESTLLVHNSIYGRQSTVNFGAYSIDLEKGRYYEILGENERAIACYEKARSQENSRWIPLDGYLRRLYAITNKPEKQLEIQVQIQGSFLKKDISPMEWNQIYPLLRAEPEKMQGDKRYAVLLKEFEDTLLSAMAEFSYYFQEKLQQLPLDEELDYILACLNLWHVKEEGISFFVLALEDYGKRTGCPCVMLHLACIYHPSLPYGLFADKLKPVRNREKSLFYWNQLLESGDYHSQDVFSKEWNSMSSAVETYTALCYLEEENPNHRTPLQDLWNQYDPDQKWRLWFQCGYYGLATLYRNDKYNAKDEQEEEHLLYQGIEDGEENCYFPLINLKETNREFDEMKRLLQLQVEQGKVHAMERLAKLYLRLKEYQEAFLAFRELCIDMPHEIEHYPSHNHEHYVLQWVDCMETIEGDEKVEGLWLGEEEKEEVFDLLHDLALGEDRSGTCSRKISKCYRNGVGCQVDFEKSIYYLTQRVEREPLSTENQALSLVQKGLYHDLGIVYVREDNPYRNESKAKVYLQLADCDHAHYFLCILFKKEENHEKAFFHGEKYVKQVGTRQYNVMAGECDLYLGECYETGKGTRQNLNKAKELYEKVSKFGMKEAKEKLKRWE